MSDLARRYTYKANSVVLGGQDILNVDAFSREFFNASFHVDLVSGSMSVQAEYSMDDMTGDPNTFRWHPFGDVMTQTTLLEVYNLVTGLRLNISSITGEIRLTLLQGTTS